MTCDGFLPATSKSSSRKFQRARIRLSRPQNWKSIDNLRASSLCCSSSGNRLSNLKPCSTSQSIDRFFSLKDKRICICPTSCRFCIKSFCSSSVTDMSCSCFGTSISHRKKGEAHAHQDLEGHSLGNTRNFPYKELGKATENFHPSNKIGRGGFGTVYKGILKNGTQVAVKTLSAESKQGVREFLTEIETISNVRHPNLVELIGCCAHGPNRILVYEYLENNSLDSALLGTKRTIKLDWGRRSAICMGTARGLAYLHEELEPHIVHRDVKASNILLDKDFRPKIGDFGLAKLFPDSITHITTRIAGTTGYLAPEYVMGGQLTLKADVYSFGILVLEVVSGRSNAKENWGGMHKLLLEWAWELYEKGKLLELVDPELEQFPEEEVIKYMKVAFFCTQSAASRRPVMSQVVDMLSRDIRLNEKELTAPGFFADSGGPSGVSSLNKKSPESSTSCQMSSVPITITEVTPR